MRFVQMPTSLLAQVDSSVGGKTGINSEHGKNLVGVFHQPQLVLADTEVLDTLPAREFRAGYAEVAKYGLIDRPDFFAWLEKNWQEIFAGGPARTQAIAESCRAKADVVARDEYETGDRALLNLGHTFGHALEAATGYDSERLVHGEGVAIGMALAHRFSSRLNLCSMDDALRVEAHLQSRRPAVAHGRHSGRAAGRRAAARLHRAGQEGHARRADLHPDPRRRPGLHRQGRAVLGGAVLSQREPAGMNSLGWIVSGVLAGIVLLAALALVLRTRLLAGFGYELVRTTPQRTAHEELRGAVADLQRDGSAFKQDRDRFGALLDLHELEVSDVMVHRTNMRSVNADNPPEAVVREILQSPHTRMPLWKGSTDNIVGVLHAKDLLRALNEVGNDFSKIDVMKIATKPWFVPDTTTLQEQLNAFLRRKAHFALVVDEYGEVEGLVTLEDIIEEIVGEIADEHDIDIQGVKQESDGSVVVDGTVPIRDLNRALDWMLPDDEATTIAGLVIHETQSIPEERQAFTFHGKRFVVMKRDKNRIAKIRIRPVDLKYDHGH